MPIIYVFIYFFGLWTLICNAAVLCGFDLHALERLFPVALIPGLVCGLIAARPVARTARENGVIPAQSIGKPQTFEWLWIVAAGAIVALRLHSGGYPIFWLFSVLFLAGWLSFGRQYRQASQEELGRMPEPSSGKRSGLALSVLVLISAGLTFAAHRPDRDDAFFVGVVSDAVAHPDLPVLRHDPLYGDDRLPLTLPTYAVDSAELFTATLAKIFGGNPMLWPYAIVPTFYAALMPLAWAFFMRVVTARWLVGTAVVLVLLGLLGETHYSYGNFAYVRLFQGKAVLASLAVPLLYGCAWRFQRSGRVWDWVTLFLCGLVTMGLSSSGIFLIPMALGIAAVASWRRGATWRSVAMFLPVAYPVACGLVLRSNFGEVSGPFYEARPSFEGTVLNVLGDHGQFLIFWGLLAGPLVVRSGRISRMLAMASLLFFVGPLNPWLFSVFCRLTTPLVVWRTLWCLPVVGFAAVGLVGVGEMASRNWGKRGLVGVGLAVAAVVFLLAPYSTLRGSNGVSFSLSPNKVPPENWDVAQAAVKVTGRGESLLAPEAISAWVPLMERRPKLVSVREIYDELLPSFVPADEARERRELRELVTGGMVPDVRIERLLNSLPKYGVGVVVTGRAVSADLTTSLVRRGFVATLARGDYLVFVLSGQHHGR